jgi:hypothetical protein
MLESQHLAKDDILSGTIAPRFQRDFPERIGLINSILIEYGVIETENVLLPYIIIA